MDNRRALRLLPVICLALASLLSGCGSSSSSSTGASAEAQSAAAGDVPDNQQFLVYRNPQAGYWIKYPEGWARKGSPTDLTFADKDNQVRIVITRGSMPAVSEARAALAKSVPASSQLKVNSAKTETVSGQPAIHLTYTVLRPADSVTGKRLTLMVDRYALANGGKVATVDESTPVGVDNVDAYRLIIESFTWL